MKRIACMLVVLATSTWPASANIDCQSRNLSRIESMICSNTDLIELDGEMSRLYFQLRNLSTRPQARALLNNQRDWLDERNGCANTGCLYRAYNSRINAFREVLE